MTDTSTFDEKDILVAALTMIAEDGWDRYDSRKLAKNCGIDLIEAMESYRTGEAVLQKLSRYLDRVMVTTAAQDLEGLSSREALFELIMQRLDAMVPFKPALREISYSRTQNWRLTLASLCNLGRTADWMLAVTGTYSCGPEGWAKNAALIQAYGRVLRVWVDEDGTELDRTMAELDKRLSQLEEWASGWERVKQGMKGRQYQRSRSEKPGPGDGEPAPAT